MGKHKVFLSSPAKGMEPYRYAVDSLLAKSDVFEIIAMERFGARHNAPEEFYRAQIEQCDIFVGLVGQRFGSCPSGSDRSHSEVEYDLAVHFKKPRLMFVVESESDIESQESQEDSDRQRNFRARVLNDRQVEFLKSAASTGGAVLNSLVNQLQVDLGPAVDAARRRIEALRMGKTTQRGTWLLFPFVSNQAGFDTGIAIANVSGNPLVSSARWDVGSFTVHYFGNMTGTKVIVSYPGPSMMGGEHGVFSLGSGGVVPATPGFQGYLLVHCQFTASGLAHIGRGTDATDYNGSCYVATELQQPPGLVAQMPHR